MVFHDETSGRELDIAEVRERIMSIDVTSVRISVRNALAAGGFPATIINKMIGALSDNEIRETHLYMMTRYFNDYVHQVQLEEQDRI